MAKYVPGLFVGEMRNKSGSTVFSRNRNGAYVRHKANPIQPRTDFQLLIRQLFAGTTGIWRTLTEQQRTSWTSLGNQIQRVDPLNQAYNLTGFQAFMLVNLRRQLNGLAVLTIPPLMTTPTPFNSASLTADESVPEIILTYAPAVPAGQYLVVNATQGWSQGKNFFSKGWFRQVIRGTGAPIASPLNITAEWQNRFGTIVAGEKIAVRIWKETTQGIPSSETMAIATVVP